MSIANKLKVFSDRVTAYNEKAAAIVKQSVQINSERDEIMHDGMKVLGINKSVVASVLSRVTVKGALVADTPAAEPQEAGDAVQPVEMLPAGETAVGDGANVPAGDAVRIGNVQNAAE